MTEVFEISEFVGGESEREHGLSVLVGPRPEADDSYTTSILLSRLWFDSIPVEDKATILEELATDPDFNKSLGEDLGVGEGSMEFNVSVSPSHSQVIMAIQYSSPKL